MTYELTGAEGMAFWPNGSQLRISDTMSPQVAQFVGEEQYGVAPIDAPTVTDIQPVIDGYRDEETAASAKLSTFVQSAKEKLNPYAGLKSRGATAEDIDELVAVDMAAFSSVYKHSGKSDEELRAELTEKFTQRFDKLGSQWIRLAERDGKIVGFVTVCPTNKKPADFESWEKTTDNGTLETTYDPNGKNLYVVSLSMLPGQGEEARNMLFTQQIGELIKGGYERAFFESRLPGLRRWMRKQLPEGVRKPEDLPFEQQLELATEYYNKTETVDGKELPFDRLLRIYHGVGCKMTKLVPNAYKDVQSMNFGAVCVLENPAPESVQRHRVARYAYGIALQAASKSPRLMKRMFQEPEDMKQPDQTQLEPVTHNEQKPDKPSWWQHVKEVAGRHKGKIALGATATSLALTFTTNTMGEIEHDAVNAWPWVVAGISTDATMVAGIGLMLAGSKAWKHPLQLRSRLPEAARNANNSNMYKAGFWINTVAALGTSAVMIAGVAEALPPSAIGTIAFPLIDAAATIALRKSLQEGIKNNLNKARPSDIPNLAELPFVLDGLAQQFPEQVA